MIMSHLSKPIRRQSSVVAMILHVRLQSHIRIFPELSHTG